jgi:hypothetical protein
MTRLLIMRRRYDGKRRKEMKKRRIRKTTNKGIGSKQRMREREREREKGGRNE